MNRNIFSRIKLMERFLQREMVRNFYHCLVHRGRLFLSDTEASLASSSPFHRVSYEGASFFRKEAKGSGEKVAE
jgi:chemotaxis methyl-accepting protein methylase